MNTGSRSQVKDYVRQGLVTVNGSTAKRPDIKIDENSDEICLRGSRLTYRKFVYYMMNKPAGVVSATQDNVSKTVLELLAPEDRRDGIFPAGRLDKDTEGFLLLTDDGELAHRLLSPARHVDKTYLVSLAHPLENADAERLQNGVDIGEEKPTLPAALERLDEDAILLTIHEGKFHQVKRMLQAVGNQVTALKRISFGGLKLDEDLRPGQYRELKEEEVEMLREA
jgi:16S rRNA pseudouridine516 synthase